jgi:hypothetical protein
MGSRDGVSEMSSWLGLLGFAGPLGFPGPIVNVTGGQVSEPVARLGVAIPSGLGSGLFLSCGLPLLEVAIRTEITYGMYRGAGGGDPFLELAPFALTG